MCRRRFQRTSEPVAQRSFDPVDQMKAEKGRRAEFVEIALQVAFSEAVEDAFFPRFQVAEHAADPVEYVVWLSGADDLCLMRVCRGIFVAKPAVRDDVSARLYSLTDEPVQRLRRAVVSKTRLWHWGMCFILIRRGCPSFDNATAQTTNIFLITHLAQPLTGWYK